MAKKLKKTSLYTINALKEEYLNYLSNNFLTQEEIAKISELDQKIKDLNTKNESIFLSITQAEEELKTLGENGSFIDIQEAISNLQFIVDYPDKIKQLELIRSGFEHFDINSVRIEANKNRYIKSAIENDKQITKLNTDYKNAKSRVSFNGEISTEEAQKQLEKLRKIVKLKNYLTILNVDIKNNADKISKLTDEKISISTKSEDKKYDSVEKFTEFLLSHNLQTSHASEIYSLMYNQKDLTISSDDFKMRKRHVKRDRFIKRGVIPTAVVAGTVGGIAGNLASQSLIAGATAHGFIPVMGTMGFTTAVVASLGVAAGLAATPAIITAKNKLTKKHYSVWYKNAKSNVSSYINGTDIENLPISKLMDKVENSKHSVYSLSQGNWLTRKFKFIPKHFVNAVNRNRIHHIEQYTKDLMAMYANIENSDLDNAEKAKKLKPIYDLLKNVDNFVSTDVNESKLFTMLTCKENGKHSHKLTIENVDIFANLKIYLDTVGLATDKNEVKTQVKESKKTIKNMEQKHAIATKLLNGERLIPKMINYQLEYARYNVLSPKEFIVNTQTVESDGSKILILSNGKSVKLGPTEFKSDASISTIVLTKNKTTINYIDGTKTEITKTKKLIPEVETARRVMLEKLKTDVDFVETFKQQGFATVTINTLKDKLEAWISNTNAKFSLSGKTKELYNEILKAINNEEILSL